CRNLTSDGSHCGACFVTCQVNAGTSANTCTNGACNPTCNATYYNIDNNAPNGCECRQDSYDVNGIDNLTPGAEEVSDCGDSRTVNANLVPSTDFDFYIAWVTDTLWCDFNLIVDLTNIPAGTNYDLYVYRWDGAAWNLVGLSINNGNTNEEVIYGGSGGEDDTAWYGFEVRRFSGPAACGNYQLSVVNGS
ncbi:MAG TPA: hypothetical protein VNN07_09895, partial [Candidatus Tectomicrobia bacterium]|nr:hypothetical protein [Candidatus Tectomicrobia bacterium]